MLLDRFCIPWSGQAYRHISSGRGLDVLDFRYAGKDFRNRWNDGTQRTLYLAGDVGVAVGEWGRHLDVDTVTDTSDDNRFRVLYRLSVQMQAVIDVRDERLVSALGLTSAPNCFLEIPIARHAANVVRTETGAQGMLVPSVAFLDDPSRWNLVLFLEKLPADVRTFITDVRPLGRLGLT